MGWVYLEKGELLIVRAAADFHDRSYERMFGAYLPEAVALLPLGSDTYLIGEQSTHEDLGFFIAEINGSELRFPANGSSMGCDTWEQ